MVKPNWRCRRFSSARMSWRSLASRLVSGSSSSRTFGRRISERPRATRCCSPPESVLGLRSIFLSSFSIAAVSFTRRSISARGTPSSTQRIGEILVGGEMRIEREGLEHHRHAAAGDRLVGPILAEDLDPALIRRDQAGDGAQRRGLADRAWPEQHEEAALRHAEGQVLERAHTAVRLAYVRQAQRIVSGLHHHPPVTATARGTCPRSPTGGPRWAERAAPSCGYQGNFCINRSFPAAGARPLLPGAARNFQPAALPPPRPLLQQHNSRRGALYIMRTPPKDARASARYARAWRAPPQPRRQPRAQSTASRARSAPPP